MKKMFGRGFDILGIGAGVILLVAMIFGAAGKAGDPVTTYSGRQVPANAYLPLAIGFGVLLILGLKGGKQVGLLILAILIGILLYAGNL